MDYVDWSSWRKDGDVRKDWEPGGWEDVSDDPANIAIAEHLEWSETSRLYDPKVLLKRT